MSDLAQELKATSTKWINETKMKTGKFQWQEGFAAFSYCMSHVPVVIKYISNQEEHHAKQTFKREYETFLKDFQIPYKEQYLFHSPE